MAPLEGDLLTVDEAPRKKVASPCLQGWVGGNRGQGALLGTFACSAVLGEVLSQLTFKVLPTLEGHKWIFIHHVYSFFNFVIS